MRDSVFDRFRKIYSAVVTPENAAESLDDDKLRRLIGWQIERGVEGFYCCGSSGEGPLLDERDRRRVVDIVREEAPSAIPVVTNVGALSTRECVSLAQAAQRSGADAVSLFPPIYYHYSPKEIESHYRWVMDAVDIPVVIYNIPQFTGVEFDHASIKRLLEDPRILGVKHTSHNMYSLERMSSAHPEKVFFNGFDEVYLSALVAGASATIGTTVNIQPELFIELRSRFRSRDIEGAQSVQGAINETISDLVEIGVFAGTKAVVGLQLAPMGPVRRPLSRVDVSDPRIARIAGRISKELDLLEHAD